MATPGRGRPRFSGVLLDWRGTLVVAPTYPWLVRRALVASGRVSDEDAIGEVLARMRTADATQVHSSRIDTDTRAHAQAYATWFRSAGIERDLADALYAVECDVAANAFADDVGPLLSTLQEAGVRVGIISDIQVDLRPTFTARTTDDGRTWADLVDGWTLSFEVGAAKPDPAVFEHALDQLGLGSGEVLMVGDRGAYDGAAAAVGITTLLLPPLQSVREQRLQRVVDLVLPGSLLSGEHDDPGDEPQGASGPGRASTLEGTHRR